MGEVNYIKSTPGEFDDSKDECIRKFGSFGYFTVRNGKAQYHMIHLPDRSCGLYYALRALLDGYMGYSRALEPLDEIRLFPEKKI